VSDNFDLDLDSITDANGGTDSAGIKNLRTQFKALKDQLAARDAELSLIRNERRTETVSELLRSKGVPEKALKLYPKDAEATEEAVSAWVAEFGEAFGIQAQDTNLSPEQQAAIQASQAAAASAPPPSPMDLTNLRAEIEAAPDRAALQAVYEKYGMKDIS
jgi:hypothetical protein